MSHASESNCVPKQAVCSSSDIVKRKSILTVLLPTFLVFSVWTTKLRERLFLLSEQVLGHDVKLDHSPQEQ
jgi:hypothetical protein